MGDNGIAPVYHSRVVPPFIEHSHIQPQHIGDIDRPGHAALIGADDHHMIGIQCEILYVAKQSFDELVSGPHRLETVQRDGVLDPGVMCVKGDNIVDTHVDEFLQGDGAVQRFSGSALMLSALIQERHDDSDSSGFTADRGDDPLEVLVVVIRRHAILLPAEGISHAVIAHIDHDIEIISPDRFLNNAFRLPGAEPRNIHIEQIGAALVPGKGERTFMLIFPLCAPFDEIVVYLFPQCLTAFQGNDAKRTDRNGFQISLFFFFCHKKSFLFWKIKCVCSGFFADSDIGTCQQTDLKVSDDPGADPLAVSVVQIFQIQICGDQCRFSKLLSFIQEREKVGSNKGAFQFRTQIIYNNQITMI